MRAVEVQIHNFRSVHDATIRLEPLSLIAGANNAGKSNIIDAIRLFYGDLKWDEGRDAPKVEASDSEAWVEIEFQPTADELAQLKDDYRSAEGTFRVRNYVSPSSGADGKVRAGYYAYEDDKLSDNLFYGAKNVGSGKVGHIVYIPAVSKVDDNTKLTGPSALRELVAEVLNKVVADSPAYLELTKAFGAFEGSIRTQTCADGQSLKSLEKEVTDEIANWEASFSLAVQNIQPEEILKTLIKPQFIDETHGGEIDQARFGAG
ncbi:MAG: AAA family ATPase, partial [Clostridiales bacterium]|nr:AAA family ATPase [Clostridiales bacterium]